MCLLSGKKTEILKTRLLSLTEAEREEELAKRHEERERKLEHDRLAQLVKETNSRRSGFHLISFLLLSCELFFKMNIFCLFKTLRLVNERFIPLWVVCMMKKMQVVIKVKNKKELDTKNHIKNRSQKMKPLQKCRLI